MRLLLDTHVFLWFISDDARLPRSFRESIRDEANEVFLSAASVWEVVVKYGLGKLPLPTPPAEYLPEQRKRHGIAGCHWLCQCERSFSIPGKTLAKPVRTLLRHSPEKR